MLATPSRIPAIPPAMHAVVSVSLPNEIACLIKSIGQSPGSANDPGNKAWDRVSMSDTLLSNTTNVLAEILVAKQPCEARIELLVIGFLGTSKFLTV
jgi:hypothetical protein